MSGNFEKIFQNDVLTKKERVELILNHQPVDRAAIHGQLSYNPKVISLYTGKKINDFDYTVEDVGEVIRKTMDTCFPPVAPKGTKRRTDDDGFVYQDDNWTSWYVSRPFDDVKGARKWFKKRIAREYKYMKEFDVQKTRMDYQDYMLGLQKLVGESIIIDSSIGTGFCSIFEKMGLEIFTYFYMEYPDDMTEFMEISTENAVKKVNAVADLKMSPVVLVAEDFATIQGPIFSPDFLEKYLYSYVKKLTEAWKSHGIKVIYHSDGNYKKVIPDLIACGVDGFYCLEPGCGMDIVELKKNWSDMVWAGGLDGIELMERGTVEDVKKEVRRQIIETGVLNSGGIIMGTASEITPNTKPENFKAMLDAAGEITNPDII
jgi:hypothetical protein